MAGVQNISKYYIHDHARARQLTAFLVVVVPAFAVRLEEAPSCCFCLFFFPLVISYYRLEQSFARNPSS